MTDEELAAIKTRAEAATQGPWTHTVFDVYIADTANGQGNAVNLFEAYTDNAEDNVTFVAHAPADVHALLAEVERLRGENAAMREIVRAVATMKMVPMPGSPSQHVCGACMAVFTDNGDGTLTPGSRHWQHCPVLRARALLAKE